MKLNLLLLYSFLCCVRCSGQQPDMEKAQQAFAKSVIDAFRKAEVESIDNPVQYYDEEPFVRLYATEQELRDAGLSSEMFINPKEDFYNANGEFYKYQVHLYFMKHYMDDGKGVHWNKVQYDSCIFKQEQLQNGSKTKLYSAYIFFYDGNAQHTRYGIRFNHVPYISGKFYAGIPLQVCYAESEEDYDRNLKQKETGSYRHNQNEVGLVVGD